MYRVLLLVIIAHHAGPIIRSRSSYFTLRDCNEAMIATLMTMTPKPGVSFRIKCERDPPPARSAPAPRAK
jgi:hypothetical protein